MRTLNGCLSDRRNDLLFEFLRFVEALRPKAIMICRATAMLSSAMPSGNRCENASLPRQGLARAAIDPAGANGDSRGAATGRWAASPLRTTGRLKTLPLLKYRC
jgi:site-specific DNA-cytosine methylase